MRGWDYEWGSALVRHNGLTAIPALLSNMQFDIGSLEPQHEALFTCNLMHVAMSETEVSHEIK
jgi:hypothetical protein